MIVRAFEELVAEKGHTGLTVQEIAKRATVNRTTFYAHFRDQYELFDHFISEAFQEELRRRLPPSAGFDKETLRALIRTHLRGTQYPHQPDPRVVVAPRRKG